MAASDSLFDSRGGFSGSNVKLSNAECLRDVAMATNFGTTLAANGLCREITTWGFRIKDGLFSFRQPLRLLVALSLSLSLSLSLDSYSCGVQNCSRRATIRLGIDTLIAHILVLCVFEPTSYTKA